ncbi:ATP synthase F1 subunit delta [Hyunsoonleella ulvae]|uniref:ATP synthase F1 subunit delta n=1 Tax=Hyunsoonleella ulvae TaxID=2799948 RepID=UPI00193A46B8|nr:ATP synthase F1 subunit delta [Hyunsoonleella ulvae]
MAGTRAAIRYAKALLSLALSEKKADKVNDDMKAIANTISENEELANVLSNSVIKTDVKKAALLAIFPKLSNLTSGLFDLLIINKRIDILPAVAEKYSVLFDEHQGKEIAQVTTAVPLTKDLEEKVLAKVKTLTSKTVKLESIVDESILGGFILRVGDKQFDASISNKLNKLKRELILN